MTRDPQELPKVLRGALYAYLLIAGVAGVLSVPGYSPLPTTSFLDGWTIALMLACVWRGKTRRIGLVMLLVGYLATRVVPAVADNSPMLDFFQAYRWVMYLVAFAMVVGRRWGPREPLRRVTLALVGMALVKAAVVFVMLGPGDRPGLFIENNFEMALFCGLFALELRDFTYSQRLAGFAMLVGLVALDGSRSGAVAFAVLVVYALSQARLTRATKVVIGIYALPLVAAVPLLVFQSREPTGGVAAIDRLQFLHEFLLETAHWGPVNWLIGTMPITPLSSHACSDLSYYQALFSSRGDGTCYSVILHAFVLRAVFDAGLVGLLIAFAVPWLTMRRAGVSKPLTVALLGIALTNSLSVSGLNNPYVCLPILLAIVLAGRSDGVPGEVAPPGAVPIDVFLDGHVEHDVAGRQGGA